MKILKDVLIKDYSYVKVGGIVKELIFPETSDELIDILNKKENYIIIGNGSNILISDKYIDKTFICLKKMKNIFKKNKNILEVDAGVKFADLVSYLRENDLSGLENLAGIPGTVGGFTYMNAGAYGTEIYDFIEEVEILDENNNIVTLKKSDINFGYRFTEFKNRKIVIIKIKIKLDSGFKWLDTVKRLENRLEKQPLNYPNFGSVFQNPKGDYSARLLQECGLKGYRIGGASFSEKHANFIVNIDNARFDDIMKLINLGRARVKEKFNIELHTEVIIVE